jgi:hypothetical protein
MYTETHDPAYADVQWRSTDDVRGAREGWVVTWHWPEKRVTRLRHLTKNCEHHHRYLDTALKCAHTRTLTEDDFVRAIPKQKGTN